MIHFIRNWFQEHPVSGLTTLGIVALLSLYFSLSSARSSHPANRPWKAGNGLAYYYDTVEKKLFEAPRDKPSPFQNDSGNLSYRAICFSCGDCSEPNLFIAYLQKGSGTSAEIALPDENPQWIPQFSENSRPIMEAILSRCSSGRPTHCLPGGAAPESQ